MAIEGRTRREFFHSTSRKIFSKSAAEAIAVALAVDLVVAIVGIAAAQQQWRHVVVIGCHHQLIRLGLDQKSEHGLKTMLDRVLSSGLSLTPKSRYHQLGYDCSDRQ